MYDDADDVIETVDPTGVATVNVYDQAGHISTSSGTYSSDLTKSVDANNHQMSLATVKGPPVCHEHGTTWGRG